jgi:hypothetical protein
MREQQLSQSDVVIPAARTYPDGQRDDHSTVRCSPVVCLEPRLRRMPRSLDIQPRAMSIQNVT